MAAPNAPAIEALPPAIRKQAIDKIAAGEPSRAVSAWLSKQGHKVSHAAIARYATRTVKPALKISTQLQAIQQTNSAQELTPSQTLSQSQALTHHALNADLILSRLSRKLERLDTGLTDTYSERDYDAASKLESVESKALELIGKATMHPGFTSAPTANVTVQQIVVMPSPTALPAIDADVIDVETEE